MNKNARRLLAGAFAILIGFFKDNLKSCRLEATHGNYARFRRLSSEMTDGSVFFAPFALGDFFAIHHHIARRLDADTHLGPVDRHDGDFYVVTNPQSFAGASREYQHGCIYACG
jgi:hypothetical protein